MRKEFDKMDRETTQSNGNILYKEESYAIQGAIFEVYSEMGCGFLEAVYQECLTREFCKRNIPFESQKGLSIHYKGEMLQQVFKPDFICYGKIIVEIKTVRQLAPEHSAQILNYLKATGMRLGILANFGSHPKAVTKRLAR